MPPSNGRISLVALICTSLLASLILILISEDLSNVSCLTVERFIELHTQKEQQKQTKLSPNRKRDFPKFKKGTKSYEAGLGRQCGLTPHFGWGDTKAGAFCDDDPNAKPFYRRETYAGLGQFPSLVIVNVTKGTGLHKACTGIIVHEHMVLSTYKCLEDPTNHTVMSGAMLIAGRARSNETQYIQIRYAWGFCRLRLSAKNKKISGDLAIIQLRDPFKFNDYVQPACLAIEKPVRKGAQCYAIRNYLVEKDKLESMTPYFVETKPINGSSSECNSLTKDQPPDKPPTTCYAAKFNDNFHNVHEGGPIYCMDRCNGQFREWVIGMEVLSWRTNDQEFMQVATFNDMKQKLAYYLTNCREVGKGVKGGRV